MSEEEKKGGWFSRLKQGLRKSSSALTEGITGIFTKKRLDKKFISNENRCKNMDELKKIIRVIEKFDETAPHDTVLILDATTGQNAVIQTEVFNDLAGVTGLIMTKLDGTARGGVLVACAEKFKLPIHAIGVGETIDDLQAFDPNDFSKMLVGVEIN